MGSLWTSDRAGCRLKLNGAGYHIPATTFKRLHHLNGVQSLSQVSGGLGL